MKKNKTWHEQLDEIVIDSIFGHNIEWNVKDVRKYILKLEELGAKEIKILDLDSMNFEMPTWHEDQVALLLFILTGGGAAGRMPSSVDHNKKKNTLRLNFDW
jgi:hypothetical protein